MTKKQKALNEINQALGLPSISEDFNRKLNEAAKAGERYVIEAELTRANAG